MQGAFTNGRDVSESRKFLFMVGFYLKGIGRSLELAIPS